jgi:hypothetical protein
VTGGAGRRAALPPAQWKPQERIVPGGSAVRFVEEATGETRVFDCAAIDAAPEIQRWLARVLARGTAGRSGVKRAASFMAYAGVLRGFALCLGGANAGVNGPGDIQPWHITAFAERYKKTKSYYGHVVVVRKFLRNDPELPARTRAALAALDVPKEPRGLAAEEYTDAEWQQIMTALRRDVRRARDRILGCRELLARFRAGEVLRGRDKHLAMLADAFERTGEFPCEPSGGYVWQVEAYGGKAAAIHRMCLTPGEMAGFALLLTAMTGENFGTVAAWPAVHVRPDGALAAGPRVALVEEVKARRGPEREHMVAPLEDLPDSLAQLLGLPDGEDRLFRSPLRVYLLLLELTRDSRSIGGHARAHSGYAAGRRDGASCWIEGVRAKHLRRWAADHGFPTVPNAVPGGAPPIDVRRIRRTVTELRRRPTAPPCATSTCCRAPAHGRRAARWSRPRLRASSRRRVPGRVSRSFPPRTWRWRPRIRTGRGPRRAWSPPSSSCWPPATRTRA